MQAGILLKILAKLTSIEEDDCVLDDFVNNRWEKISRNGMSRIRIVIR